MNEISYTPGVNIENVFGAGVWNQTVTPELEMPNTEGDSLSHSLTEPPQSPRITLSIDEHLLFAQRHRGLTERFNEAYDEDARREDEQFFRATGRYYRRRSSAED